METQDLFFLEFPICQNMNELKAETGRRRDAEGLIEIIAYVGP
jgi:hypothetical protein